jgi:hypothetical protein
MQEREVSILSQLNDDRNVTQIIIIFLCRMQATLSQIYR